MNRAFTLIELLVVISIITLLSSLVLASVSNARDKARIASALQFEQTVHNQLMTEDINSLVAWYDFDEGVGSIVGDSSGYGNDGNRINSPAWTDGILGGALQFDGTSSRRVEAPDNSTLDFGSGDNLTVTAWVKTSSSSSQRIMQKYSAPQGWALFSNTGWVGSLSFNTWSGSGGLAASNEGDGDYNDGKWHFIVGVRDQDANEMRLYIDGVLIDTEPEVDRDLTNSGDLHIGTDYLNGNSFNGLIDNVRVYNRAFEL